MRPAKAGDLGEIESISVLIPSYNGAEFLPAALGSVLAQTCPPAEILVIDDASTDATADVVRDVAGRSGSVPIRFIRMPANTGGPGAPLNRGVRESRGAVIAILEQDDTMMPTRLQRQSACLRREPSLGLVFSRCVYVHDIEETKETERLTAPLDPEPLGDGMYRLRSRNAYAALVQGMYALTCSTFLFPRTAWEVAGGFSECIRTSCDTAFLQAVSRRYSIGFVDEALVGWKIRSQSLLRTAAKLVRVHDRLCILSGFDVMSLDPETQTFLRRRLRDELHAAAPLLREAGRSSMAFGCSFWATAVQRLSLRMGLFGVRWLAMAIR